MTQLRKGALLDAIVHDKLFADELGPVVHKAWPMEPGFENYGWDPLDALSADGKYGRRVRLGYVFCPKNYGIWPPKVRTIEDIPERRLELLREHGMDLALAAGIDGVARARVRAVPDYSEDVDDDYSWHLVKMKLLTGGHHLTVTITWAPDVPDWVMVLLNAMRHYDDAGNFTLVKPDGPSEMIQAKGLAEATCLAALVAFGHSIQEEDYASWELYTPQPTLPEDPPPASLPGEAVAPGAAADPQGDVGAGSVD